MQATSLTAPQMSAQAYRVEIHETVTSTNELALAAARQGDQGQLWIVAGEQTQGVGRRGRVWHSPKGNLYASLLLVADYAADKAARLGFVAGVAMAEALTRCIGQAAKIRLKWPNDVLLDGAKLTGILIERHPLQRGKAAIIIGLGINVVHAPATVNYAATSLKMSGFDIVPEQIFNPLVDCWAVNFDLWNDGRGFEHIRQKWLASAAGLGKQIHVEQQGQRISGIFKTIDVNGQLVIEQRHGEQLVISAGDVHFGDVGTYHQKIKIEKQNA